MLRRLTRVSLLIVMVHGSLNWATEWLIVLCVCRRHRNGQEPVRTSWLQGTGGNAAYPHRAENQVKSTCEMRNTFRTLALSGNASWLPRVPIGGLLVRVRNGQHGRFVERLSEELQSDRQPIAEPARNRNAGDSSHVCRNREDIGQVHLVRILGPRANGEGHGRRGRATIASTCSNAISKSRLIRVRTFCAFT